MTHCLKNRSVEFKATSPLGGTKCHHFDLFLSFEDN